MFAQSPGLTAADTKLDLTQNPWGFLTQALEPWTDVFPLGQLQNQAYGYLFPHGLFFAVFSWAPAWVVQRLWWALLLMLAFAGTIKLLQAAGIGSRPSRVAAGILFALSPRILTTLGAISSEAWVVALAPWVLLPLVQVLPRYAGLGELDHRVKRDLRRAALRSAVAALLMGAVNAVATAVAILPAVIWWLLAFTKGPRRASVRYFSRWWVPAGIAATFWWIGPLLILGRYSPPFTDYIESSSLTTRWLNQLEVLRGTTSWVPFLSSERVAGAAMVSESIFVLTTLIVAFLGLWGLARRDLPHVARWLTILGVGLFALAIATAPFSPVADAARDFLDGPGAALRNLHKFDVLVRLPLIVGFAHLLGQIKVPDFSATGRDEWRHPERNFHVAGAMATALLLVLVTAPGWSGRIAPTDGFDKVPAYWEETADWLNANAAEASDGRTMILPEARFGRQTWGNTRDEPAQPLLDVPWVVRDSVPLVQPGAIRGLDGVQREVHSGEPIPSLADTLRAQGVGHVVVRADLTTAADTPGAEQVMRTLRRSGGFEEVAHFGRSNDRGGSAVVDGDSQGSPALRIFAVSPEGSAATPAGGLRQVSPDQVEVVHAGPEALPRLDAADRVLGRHSAPRVRILERQLPEADSGADVFRDHAPQTVTDTPARRDHNYGNVVDADSEIRAKDDESLVLNPVQDYPVSDPVAKAGAASVADTDRSNVDLTEVKTTGGKVRASSAASDPTGFGGARTMSSLTSVVDGDPETAWYPSPGRSVGQYLEFELDEARDKLQVSFLTEGSTARIHLETFNADRGDTVLGSTTVTATAGEWNKVSLPGGRADRVRLTLLGSFRDVGLAEVDIFGANHGGETMNVTPTRMPTVPAVDGDDSAYLNRWVFGQEIPEQTMLREFTVPEHLAGEELRIDMDTCSQSEAVQKPAVIDGEQHHCDSTFNLSAGPHIIESSARWTAISLAEPLYHAAVEQAAAPMVAEPTENGDYHVDYSTEPRLIFLPESANPGRTAHLQTEDHRMNLHPVTVNGWQQGWVVPAGMAGTISIGFAATAIYQAWLAAGAVFAAILLGLWAWSEYRGGRGVRRREDDEDLATPATRPGIFTAVAATTGTAVLTGAIGGVAGLAVFAGVATITGLATWKWPRRGRKASLFGIGGTTAAIAAVYATQQPWTATHYAGDSWVTQLALLALICVTYSAHLLAMAARAGSSTKE